MPVQSGVRWFAACDGCGYLSMLAMPTPQEAAEQALYYHWTRTGDGRYLCPTCAPQARRDGANEATKQ